MVRTDRAVCPGIVIEGYNFGIYIFETFSCFCNIHQHRLLSGILRSFPEQHLRQASSSAPKVHDKPLYSSCHDGNDV